MILELATMSGCLYGIYKLNNHTKIQERKYIKSIENKWELLMDSLGSKVEDKIEKRYELLKIIPKQYGFDAIVSIPIGLSSVEFRKLLPSIQQLYKADVIAEPSNDKNSMYMRVNDNDKLSEKDVIRLKWYRYFNNGKDFRNSFGETYKITNINDVLSPSKEIIGYKLLVTIPSELTYSNLVKEVNDLSRVFDKCFIDFNDKTKQAECTVITKPIDDNTKFSPVKCEPWQVYVGMDYTYKPIILDYKESANALIAGKVGSGKTVAMIMGFINLCSQREDFDLVVAMMSEKEDLRIFKDVKQCRCYSNNAEKTLKLLQWLNSEMRRRNRLFAEMDNYCTNIYKYNSLVKKNKKIKILHVLIDEIADFMIDTKYSDLLFNLIRKSRSCGIYLTVATQRASINNLSPEVKGQLSNKVCFNMVNSASALTVLSGEGLAIRAVELEKSREFIVDYTDGLDIAKTLYLSEDMMVNLLKDKLDKDKKRLFDEIVDEESLKPSKESKTNNKGLFSNINSK